MKKLSLSKTVDLITFIGMFALAVLILFPFKVVESKVDEYEVLNPNKTVEIGEEIIYRIQATKYYDVGEIINVDLVNENPALPAYKLVNDLSAGKSAFPKGDIDITIPRKIPEFGLSGLPVMCGDYRIYITLEAYLPFFQLRNVITELKTEVFRVCANT